MNWGIVSLLGFIGLVLGGVAAFAFFLRRRAAAQAELEPVQAEVEDLAPRRGLPNRRQNSFATVPHTCSQHPIRGETASLKR